MSSWARFTIGIFSLFFAWIFIISRDASSSPLTSWALITFCVLIALACFSRTARGPALRIIGATIFSCYVIYLFLELRRGIFQPYRGQGSRHWLNALEGLFVFGLPGLYLALRGIYPAWGRGAAVFRNESSTSEQEQDPDHRP